MVRTDADLQIQRKRGWFMKRKTALLLCLLLCLLSLAGCRRYEHIADVAETEESLSLIHIYRVFFNSRSGKTVNVYMVSSQPPQN